MSSPVDGTEQVCLGSLGTSAIPLSHTGCPSLRVESAGCLFTATKPLAGMGAAVGGEQSLQGVRRQET